MRIATGCVISAAIACAAVGCTEKIQPMVAAPSTVQSPNLATTVVSVQVGVAGNAEPLVVPEGTLRFWAMAVYGDGHSSDVTNAALWQSSNPVVAIVSNQGVATGAVEGTFDVSASYATVSGTLRAEVRRRGCNASTLSPDAQTVSAFTRTTTVTVTAVRGDCRWIATSDADWLRLSGSDRTRFDPGRSGSGTFSYDVLSNNSPDERSGHITLSFTDGTQIALTVVQEHPVSCVYIVSPDETFLASAGGAAGFDVSTIPPTCMWTATSSSTTTVITSANRGTGPGRVTFTATANTSTSNRDTTITVAGLTPGLNPTAIHRVHTAGR